MQNFSLISAFLRFKTPEIMLTLTGQSGGAVTTIAGDCELGEWGLRDGTDFIFCISSSDSP